MIPGLDWWTWAATKIQILFFGGQFEIRLDSVVFRFGRGGLKTSGNGRAVGAHLLQIYCSCNDFDVIETEL